MGCGGVFSVGPVPWARGDSVPGPPVWASRPVPCAVPSRRGVLVPRWIWGPRGERCRCPFPALPVLAWVPLLVPLGCQGFWGCSGGERRPCPHGRRGLQGCVCASGCLSFEFPFRTCWAEGKRVFWRDEKLESALTSLPAARAGSWHGDPELHGGFPECGFCPPSLAGCSVRPPGCGYRTCTPTCGDAPERQR